MPIISSLIGAGSSLLGNIIGASSQNSANKTNLRINQMNNEFNERMMQKQLDYQTDMWNKTNEYNDPSNVRKRLEQAGLNPAHALGQTASGMASAMSGSGTSAGPSGNQQGFRPDLSGIGDAISQGIQLSEMKKNNLSNRSLQQANEDLIRTQQKYYGAKALAEIAEMQSRTRSHDLDSSAKAISNSFLRDNLSADLANKRRQGQLMQLEQESKIIHNAYNNAVLQNYGKKFAADMAEQFARIANLKQHKRLTDRQVESELQKSLKLAAERNGINLENKKKYRTLESEINKAFAESYSAMSPFGFGLYYLDRD